MRLNIFNQKILALMLTIAALMTGQTAWAVSVTYTFSGTTKQDGTVNLDVTASGDITGTERKTWNNNSTQSVENMSLYGNLKLSFGSDKTSSLSVKTGLSIEATSSTGGYITLASG